jgi:hypothetical protein
MVALTVAVPPPCAWNAAPPSETVGALCALPGAMSTSAVVAVPATVTMRPTEGALLATVAVRPKPPARTAWRGPAPGWLNSPLPSDRAGPTQAAKGTSEASVAAVPGSAGLQSSILTPGGTTLIVPDVTLAKVLAPAATRAEASIVASPVTVGSPFGASRPWT